jgi:hypothetical protein
MPAPFSRVVNGPEQALVATNTPRMATFLIVCFMEASLRFLGAIGRWQSAEQCNARYYQIGHFPARKLSFHVTTLSYY